MRGECGNMTKLTNEERVKQEELAENYAKIVQENKNRIYQSLNDDQKKFIDESSGNLDNEFFQHLADGKKPSEFFKTSGEWLFDGCILKRHRDAFLYMADNCTAFIFRTGRNRKTFRSSYYNYYYVLIHNIIDSFQCLNCMDVDYADFIENNLSMEQLAYKRQKMSVWEEYLLAYEIDAGNERVINYVKNVIESGSDTTISWQKLAGIFMCKNTELHGLMCRLLLAARLQEGLRQAVCETCGCGRIEPFLMILHTIRDNNLIRFSSVKRAVGCYTGMISEDSNDIERISSKTLELIINCLENENYRNNCLNSEDSMKIYIALWALACREYQDCRTKLVEIINHGTSHQIMTVGVFLWNFPQYFRRRLAILAILQHHDELDVVAVYLCQIERTSLVYSNSERKMVKTDMSQRYNRETAEALYDTLNEILKKLPKKKLEFNPCVFPWHEAQLSQSDIAERLCMIASDLDDDEKIDETCVKIPLIKSSSNYDTERSQQVQMLLSNPRTETQLDMLVSLAGDKETSTRQCAFGILSRCELTEKHFKTLEDMLKYKSANMRQNLINTLFRQPEEQLFECVKRLCSDKKEEKRTAGLDMVIRISESEKSSETKSRYKALAQLVENPTSKEQILIDRINASKITEKGYGLFMEEDSFTPETDAGFIASCKADFVKLFPETRLFDNQPSQNRIGLHEILSALDQLIEEHKNDEYKNAYAGELLLASDSDYYRFEVEEPDGSIHIAFKELWDEFYKQHINNSSLLFMLQLYTSKSGSMKKFTEKAFGSEIMETHTYMHFPIINSILRYYYREYYKREACFTAACALGYYIAYEADAEELYDIFPAEKYHYPAIIYLDGKKVPDDPEHEDINTVISDDRLNLLLDLLCRDSAESGRHFKDVFSIRFMLGKRFGFFDMHKQNYRAHVVKYVPFSIPDLTLAAYKKIISCGFLYKMLMTKFLSDTLSELSLFIYRKKAAEVKADAKFYDFWHSESFVKSILEIHDSSEKLSEHEFTDEEHKRLDFAAEIGEKIIAAVLKTELARGDTETEFSCRLNNIRHIYGLENFVKILAAMGHDTFDRNVYFYTHNGVSKKQALSRLLKICIPDKNDNARKLKELVAKTDVTEKRIVEAALFSPAWINIVEEYLGWNGFKSACYYFIAHMDELADMETQAVIAKYTPISTHDLNTGAFDVEWFKDALQTAGEERFDKIYDAAKYISSGAKHTRARKYADAVRGKLNKAETLTAINEKRNKDTLMAYALIPLEDENDMAERYLFIQEFKNQSKKFGAQRRANEEAAADCALQNLSGNAGFTDVSRLTLRMETKLFENVKPMLDWNEIDEIRLKIEIDDNGNAKLKCEKDGKALKSIPAKYKKNETVIIFQNTRKQLTEQYRRTRRMFEDAMEDKTEFTAGELELLCTNSVIKPVISRLVYKAGDKLGFLDGILLRDFSGKESKISGKTRLKIAHPYDIYMDGHWHEYQKYLFENEVVQPFKQVFRELYVKTAEEAQAYHSLRYAGNQIQPLKTKACLKTRRWIADVGEGLQKVYYKENIIATIYALADWFSPAEIEAPTLEWVAFYNRKTGQALKIADIPDIIFSEVMRDVDLAVSVAHAGNVDPETSHSTVEMRKAIVEFTLPLFRLSNVRLEGSHAFISGERADYSIHLGSGVVHLQGGPMINVLPVHSQHRGRLFLPFVDDDPKTAQIISEILLFAEDRKIKDPFILEQIK